MRIGLCATLIAMAMLWPGASASAGSCVTVKAPLVGEPALPEVPTQRCTLGEGGDARTVNVTLLRLNEVLAGNLAKSEATPELANLFAAKLIDNQALASLRELFEKFGHKDVQVAEDTSLTVNVRTEQGSNGRWFSTNSLALPPAMRGTKRRLWWLTSTFSSGYSSEPSAFPIYLKNAYNEMLKTTRWPAGFKMYYTCSRRRGYGDAVGCTRIWRTAAITELDKIASETTAEWRRVDRELMGQDADQSPPESNPEEESDYVDTRRIYKQHFELLRHLGKNALPQSFLVLAGQSDAEADGCTNSIAPAFHYYMRPLAIEVALFENDTNQPVALTSLLGAKLGGPGLAVRDDETAESASLPDTQLELAPGGRAIVVLRIVFSDALEKWRDPRQILDAEYMYSEIKKKPSKSVFALRAGSGGTEKYDMVIRKSASAFQKPEIPNLTEFTFGPHLHLTGLSTAADTATLADMTPLPVVLTDHYTNMADNAEGSRITETEDTNGGGANEPPTEIKLTSNFSTDSSCPILYTFDADRAEWVNHGKVIHTAKEAANEATEVVEVDPDVRRIRLAEEEPEVTHLRRLVLALTLRDGSRQLFLPRESYRARREGFLLRLPGYSAAEFNFDVPIAASEIIKSELEITGYYQRYDTRPALQQVHALPLR